jgi:hypothetical protein
MDTKRIKMGHQRGEVAPNTFPDFNWIREHEDELLEKYGECSIIVYNQQVIGVGATYQEAIDDAERNLPPETGEITPVHDWLHYRQPFYGFLRLKTKSE